MLSSSEASIQISQCGYRSDLSRALRRDCVPSKVAVHEDCDLVNMFLSSESQRCFGLSHQISRCTFQRDQVEYTRLLFLQAKCFAVSARSNLSWARYESLMHADLYLVSSSLFRIGLRLPNNTSLSSSFSRGVLSALVFVSHPDSLMMSGACLKASSTSKYCPIGSTPTLNTRFNNRRLFTSDSSNPRVPMSFAVYLDLRRLSMSLSPSSSDKHTKSSSCSATLTSWFGLWTVLRYVCPFGYIVSLHISSSPSQTAKCGKHLEFRTCSWPICQLCLRHTFDDPLREVWCKMSLCAVPWKCALLMSLCLNFNGSPQFDKLTVIMIETSTFTTSRGGIAENNWEAGTSLRILPCFFVLYSRAHNLDRMFLRVGSTDLSVSTQIKSNGFHACILAFLLWNNLIDTFGMYPINLFLSRSQHKIFRQVPTVDIIPESSSFFQDLIIVKRDFWYWACNSLNCIQLSILFELFTKRLQNRRNHFWRIRVQQASQDSSNFPPKLPGHAPQSNSPRLSWFSNCWWKTPSILIASSHDACPSGC